MRGLPLLLLLACSEDVLPLEGANQPGDEQCSAALLKQQTIFEDQTVIDPPEAAAINGEVALVLNQDSLEVVRFSSDARDPDPIASHTAELSRVLALVGRDGDYHLVTQLYTDAGVWVAQQRMIGSTKPTSWRIADQALVFGAAVSDDVPLVAVRTSENTFRIHAADKTSVRGATFDALGEIAGVRIFPEARLVAAWTRFSSGGVVALHPFDPITGDPTGPPQTGFCDSFLRHPIPIDITNSGFAVVDCEDRTKLLRLEDGQMLDLTTGAPRVSSRITTDATGKIGVATWSEEDLAPIFHVVDPETLQLIGDPIPLEAQDEWGTPSRVAVTADPVHPGRFAVLASYVFGHGWGRMRFTRINTCSE